MREKNKAEATGAARERPNSDSRPAAVNPKSRHQAVGQATGSEVDRALAQKQKEAVGQATGSEFDRARQALAAFTLKP